AGNAVSIPVLANDTDPERDRLTITAIVPPSSGDAFFTANTVKFLAPAAPGVVTMGYSIRDPYKNPASGKITIEVLTAQAPDATTNNAPPAPPDILARGFVGQTIPIDLPVASSDPDGDAVVVTGVAEPPEIGAITAFDGRTFTYQAPSDSEVGGTV